MEKDQNIKDKPESKDDDHMLGNKDKIQPQEPKNSESETTEQELMHTVFPHPTLSEMMKEAVLDAYGRVLNI